MLTRFEFGFNWPPPFAFPPPLPATPPTPTFPPPVAPTAPAPSAAANCPLGGTNAELFELLCCVACAAVAAAVVLGVCALGDCDAPGDLLVVDCPELESWFFAADDLLPDLEDLDSFFEAAGVVEGVVGVEVSSSPSFPGRFFPCLRHGCNGVDRMRTSHGNL